MDNPDITKYNRRRDFCIFIWNNYSKPLTLKDTGKAIHTSERTIERCILDHFQAGFKEVLNAVRFHKTIKHHAQHGGNIAHSALENGFSDRQTFLRWWNRWMNIPLNHQKLDNETITRGLRKDYKNLIKRIQSFIPEKM